VSTTKDLTILAVTKMHGGVCTAGIDSSGTWVRPTRPRATKTLKTPEQSFITDHCLLPLDFFHGGKPHLVSMGITRFWLAAHRPEPPHVEDWIVDLKQKPTLIGRLSPEEQESFLAKFAEHDLGVLESAAGRSLALFKADDFVFTFAENKFRGDIAVRASFAIGGREVMDVACTDLRMRALGRQLLEKRAEPGCILTADDFKRRGKGSVYLAVGLSRLYRAKHWMILVGVHCLPEIEVEINYSKL
jgi:hypothetical protein